MSAIAHMSPQPSIAHYRITGKLGEGGMGVVYRATDTKLNRDVAIKILPEACASDPDRLARFTREAKVLASLNHPNIAHIYGVEEGALVMELVEGLMLEERIGQGPIPLEEALPMARQMAEALEYAHERSVVHRDFKPANVKITPEGRVKVLDFGLAKAMSPEVSASSDATDSPTMTMRATVEGVILGTAAYMSPEQAKGKPVDRRADIWSFGVVLFEMLSGSRMYGGETVSETLAAVIMKEPDLSALPTAPRPRPPFGRCCGCLDKDPLRRLRAISARRACCWSARLPMSKAACSRPRRPLLESALDRGGGAGDGGRGARRGPFRESRGPAPLMRFSVEAPEEVSFSAWLFRRMAVGLVFTATGGIYVGQVGISGSAPIGRNRRWYAVLLVAEQPARRTVTIRGQAQEDRHLRGIVANPVRCSGQRPGAGRLLERRGCDPIRHPCHSHFAGFGGRGNGFARYRFGLFTRGTLPLLSHLSARWPAFCIFAPLGARRGERDFFRLVGCATRGAKPQANPGGRSQSGIRAGCGTR